MDELKAWTRDAALLQLRERGWLAGGGTMFRGSPIAQISLAYGPKAEADPHPAHAHVEAIADAMRAASDYLASRTDGALAAPAMTGIDGEDGRLRRLLERMNWSKVRVERFDARAPWEATRVVLSYDAIGTMIPDGGHSRKLLVDAVRRERLRVGEAPIVAPRRIALLSILAGWWPRTATLAMTAKQVIALEEKNAREELGRQEKRSKAVQTKARELDAATTKGERKKLAADLRALMGRRR